MFAALATFPPSSFLTFVAVFSRCCLSICFARLALVGFTLQSFSLSHSTTALSLVFAFLSFQPSGLLLGLRAFKAFIRVKVRR